MSTADANSPVTLTGGSLPILPNGTYNVHIAMMVRLIDRAIIEVTRSQSSPGSGVRSADADRIEQYMAEMESFVNFSSRLPETDTPKSHPLAVQFDQPLELPRIENDSMWLLSQMLDTMRIEVGQSASSRQPNGWWKPDLPRVTKYIEDVRTFMAQHVMKVTPVDVPESSPREQIQPTGRLGV
jgi:hypothetical protein